MLGFIIKSLISVAINKVMEKKIEESPNIPEVIEAQEEK